MSDKQIQKVNLPETDASRPGTSRVNSSGRFNVVIAISRSGQVGQVGVSLAPET